MAYLKRYSPGSDKRGFYIDGRSWTLQTSFRADRFFRDSSHFRDDTQLPKTVTKALIHLGEAETGGRTPKQEMLDWFPHLNPQYCDLDDGAVEELREFITDTLADSGLKKSEFEALNTFIRTETPMEPFQWQDSYAP